MISDRGYIRLPRNLFERKSVNTRNDVASRKEALVWLIMNAQYAPTTITVGDLHVTVGRGQLYHSNRFLARAWGWSEMSVRRFFSALRDDSLITCTNVSGQTLISICNYALYQGFSSDGVSLMSQENADGDAKKKKGKKGKEGNLREEGGADAPAPPAPPAQKPEVGDQFDLLGDVPSTTPRVDQIVEAIEAWNAMAMPRGLACASTNPSEIPVLRRRAIENRLRKSGMDGWVEVVRMIGASRHLCGDNNNGFKAKIDYALRDMNFQQIREGTYADAPASAPRARSGYQSPRQERASEARKLLDKLGLGPGAEPPPPDDFEGVTLDNTEFSILEDRKV